MITIWPEETPITMRAGTTHRFGADSASMTEGGSGFGTRLVYHQMDSGEYHYSTGVPLPMAAPWYMEGTVPATGGGTDAHPYGIYIWTSDNAYGITLPNFYYDHEACGPPPVSGYCQHGTRLKGSEAYVEPIAESVLYKWLQDHRLDWLFPIVSQFIGTSVDKDKLCGAAPPEVPELTPFILLNTGFYTIPILHRILWDIFCECIPGEPPPVQPPIYNPPRPPGMPSGPTIILNPTNPCLSIEDVLRKLDEILRITGLDLQFDTFMQRQLVPSGTASGALHTGLVGGGSFEISAAIGVQIVIRARPPGARELEGAPNYVWDLGWASIMDGNGFIQERRITRDVEVWMPRLFSDATTFGYFFKEGVVADVKVLHLLP